jgi:hypothetical protein
MFIERETYRSHNVTALRLNLKDAEPGTVISVFMYFICPLKPCIYRGIPRSLESWLLAGARLLTIFYFSATLPAFYFTHIYDSFAQHVLSSTLWVLYACRESSPHRPPGPPHCVHIQLGGKIEASPRRVGRSAARGIRPVACRRPRAPPRHCQAGRPLPWPPPCSPE